ncbi:MAG TPA: signal recognition particle-docking protein FtsY [Bacteroidetes bacterium]|nr:signal recognition particle-docking protein FtsY [Bacteroidota bacterium]
MGFFDKIFTRDKKEKLDQGLEKTKSSLLGKIGKALAGKSTIGEGFLDELEEILVTADVGIETTLKIIDRIEKRVQKDKYLGEDELNTMLKEEIADLLPEQDETLSREFHVPAGPKPYVIMVVGVNGVGKTTTIGKMAHQFKAKGYKVVLGAADTFRAAAVEQLKIWGQRTGVEVIEKGMNADPAAVAFEAVKAAQDQGADVCIIDTAGRLHNKINLMNELSKIKRVMQKVVPDAPQEILLVLDASTGQNAFEQARQFTAATEVNALALTKLDGTAKGGVVIGVSEQFKTPVRYIGVGEGVEDLQVFNKYEFIDSLFSK